MSKHKEAFQILLIMLIMILVLGYGLGRIYGFVLFPDEFGYWAHAAGILGYDWSSITSLGSYYSFGYSVILIPIMALFNNAVIAEAGLSYLGIGVQPPDASLGRMLSESQAYLFSAPLNALVPGIAMIIMILGFTLLADGLKKNA